MLTAKIQAGEAERVEDTKRTAQQTVQEAIDSVPALAHLQAADPEGFAIAQQLDVQFSKTPKFATLPLAERFQKVIAAYEAAHGPVPVKQTQAVTKPPAQAPAAQPAKPASKGPQSLSDIHGGYSPGVDSRAELAEGSGADIAAKMMAMSPDAQDKFLASMIS